MRLPVLINAACVMALMATLPACNTLGRQPAIRDAQIAPAELQPRDVALISMKIIDRYELVDRVEGIVLEDPRVTFRLNDQGQAGDEKAGDGVWSCQVEVPFQAPPGSFTLEFTVFRSDGQPIIIRNEEGNTQPLKSSFVMVIRHPDPNATPEVPTADKESDKPAKE